MDDERTKFAELEKLIAEHKDQKGALMPVLQGAQAIFGCVSEDVQKGSQSILDKLSQVLDIPVGGTTPDGKFTLEATRCLGACGLAPVMMINGQVYGRLTPDAIPAIIDKYKNDDGESA